MPFALHHHRARGGKLTMASETSPSAPPLPPVSPSFGGRSARASNSGAMAVAREGISRSVSFDNNDIEYDAALGLL